MVPVVKIHMYNVKVKINVYEVITWFKRTLIK